MCVSLFYSDANCGTAFVAIVLEFVSKCAFILLLLWPNNSILHRLGINENADLTNSLGQA